VRETATLTLGSATVLGGQGAATGGGGGGGVAGGGGSSTAGGGGGASFAVGSGYGLTEGDALTVPCEAEGFCAQNWLSPADTDQPTVVITFWQNGEPTIPADGDTIDTDQPSLVFDGADASEGIHYLLENPLGEIVNYSGLINGTATGNLLWTVPPGLLAEGLTYDWFVTDQSGTPLQDPRSFTVAPGTAPSGLTQGWTLYVRSMDNLDTSLPANLQPLGNQPVPTVHTSCQCTCEKNDGLGTATLPAEEPGFEPASLGDTYPSCGGYDSGDYCDCNWNATGDKPTAGGYWYWMAATGTGCTASSGSCYANAQVQTGTIDIDWASASNPLGLQVPSRLINITSEPSSPNAGDPIPSLAVPAIADFSGSCADSSQVEVTFTARTNGGIRFQIYGDPETGKQTSSANTAINYWNIPNNCSWSGSSAQSGGSGDQGASQAYSNEYMKAQIYEACQASVAEQTGSQSFCLTPGTPYRVRFDGVQPYLPGPMELGFKLAGMDSSAPIPANWVSTCTLDATTNNCDASLVALSGPPAHAGRPANPGPPAYAGPPADVGPPDHARNPGERGRHGRPGLGSGLMSGEEGTAGTASCTGAGSTITCTWTSNGTWELPALYTEPGGWITVQAVGGAGGAGNPATSNPGGAAGRAQAVLPAESLAGATLYAYVGESGVPARTDANAQDSGLVGAGGAASVVTTSPIPSSFVSSGCTGTPEDIDALVIAGGGGSGGAPISNTTSASGGSGGIAVGGSGVQQTIGSGSPGGQGGQAWGGRSPAYGSNPFDGTATVSGGYGVTYDNAYTITPGNGPLAFGGAGYDPYSFPITPSATFSWMNNSSYLALGKPSDIATCGAGMSGLESSGGGGGGHAAGGGGSQSWPAQPAFGKPIYPSGGGGGSSWATGAGAGVKLPSAHSGWKTLANSGPSQIEISVQCPECMFIADCAMEDTSLRPVMRCTLPTSILPLELDVLASAVASEIGQAIGDDVPVYLEAWGGHGGNGGEAYSGCVDAPGGTGGLPGYARSSHTFGTLSDWTSELWLYAGAKGGDGPYNSAIDFQCPTTYAPPGAGGAGTLVLPSQLTSSVALDDVLLIAAGGGGGGQGRAGDFAYDGEPGNAGGSAIASTSAAAQAGGQGLPSAIGDGTGACGPAQIRGCGSDGIGGLGGGVEFGAGTTGWVGTSSGWSQGQGGYSVGGSAFGGAGGGGYGGGSAGGSGTGRSEGGGAGGSYAAQATLNDTGAPVLGPDGNPSSTNGVVVISFDVCSTYPTLSVCQP